MKITPGKAEEARQLLGTLRETWDELKGILKDSMTKFEYERFRGYACGHFEGALSNDYGWLGHKDTIEKFVEQAEEDAESLKCKKCGNTLDDDGFCTNEDCFYFDEPQSEIDIAEEDEEELRRRDEKNGLYPERGDIAN
jgi:hypothetical protein